MHLTRSTLRNESITEGDVAVCRAVLAVATTLMCAIGVIVGTHPDHLRIARVIAGSPRPVPPACAPKWVTGWHASAQPGAADPALAGATLRMIVYPQVTGPEVRVRLSNAYGEAPLVIGTVSAARTEGTAALVAGTLRRVAFGGMSGAVIPPGEEVLSDPVPVVAEAGKPLAVSIYLPVRPDVVTRHALSLQTSYMSRAGDVALDDRATTFDTPLYSWLVLTGVEVLAPRATNAVIAIGDSITDGMGGRLDAQQRWSDALAARLASAGGASRMAVLNAGISSNRLLVDATRIGGDSPLTRLGRDVRAVQNLTDVVLNGGTNDVADGRSAEEIVAGLQAFAARVHAAGKRVFLTTITPSEAREHGAPAAIATRAAVNAWILGHGREHADGVFDFAAAVADRARPSRLAPAFDAGDGLHLSAAGYHALANAVDITQLTGSPCLADTSPVLLAIAQR